MIPELQSCFFQGLNAFFNLTGAFGVALVIYGVISHKTGEKWLPLEMIAKYINPAITLSSAILVAVSIYFPVNPRPPLALSKFFTAPLMVIAGLISFYYLYKNNWSVSEYFIQGLAIVALSGSLIRLMVY